LGHNLINYNLSFTEPGLLLVLWPLAYTIELLKLFHSQASNSNLLFPLEVIYCSDILLYIFKRDSRAKIMPVFRQRRDNKARSKGVRDKKQKEVNCLIVKGGHHCGRRGSL
jgi:hypothetical protein